MRTNSLLCPMVAMLVSALASACESSPADTGDSPTGVGGSPTGNPSGTQTPGASPTGPAGVAPTPGNTDVGPGVVAPVQPTMPGPGMTGPGMTGPGPADPGPMDPGPVDPGPVDPGPGTDPAPGAGGGTGETDVMMTDTEGEGGGSSETDMDPMGAGGMMGGDDPVGGGDRGEGPCDIYNAAGNECVAAYSTVRALLSSYDGPLYQIRRGGPSPNTGSGGETMDIGVLANGFADGAAHEAFCGNETCTFSVLYDQSGRGNDLTVAKRGCYGCSEPQQQCNSCTDTACEDDYESDATIGLSVGGNDVFALYMDVHEGYRNNGTAWPTEAPPADGMPTGNAPDGQGVYMVAEGSGLRPDAASACCWNFGNVSNNNCYGPSGQMNALMLGRAYWGRGAGDGPWFMGDFEAGVWAGGTSGDINAGGFDTNNNLPSMTMDYAFGVLKTQPNNYAIRVGDATNGNLTTAYDGPTPTVFPGGAWSMEGGIALGIGGDNSNHASGTFLEGAITSSRPSDETDAAIHENVKAAGYGQ